MKKNHFDKQTPSEFYRLRRPEYFSDSEVESEIILPREQLAYEINQISKNQKQDEFETLVRKLAEKFIAPNLIPQVGPTGGGDGKTDTETHPVSDSISERWFIPENGWEKDEKWAFAISSKEKWKSKLKGDIDKIIKTEREYTHIFFITNQTPSSKKKKDAQDEFKKEFNIEITILDGEWILEKIYNNNLIDITVDSLNLSDIYKNKRLILGKNDSDRIKKLYEIEEKINNTNRYFEYDFQLVEDALQAAILSRMLERPRDEVEGKFARALRFCKKVNIDKQWLRLYYQRAWTYLNWYDDYELFVSDYCNFKKYISNAPTMIEIELYSNLINLLRGISASQNLTLPKFNLDINKEISDFVDLLNLISNDSSKPSTSLVAKTYIDLHGLIDSIVNNNDQNQFIKNISNHILKSENLLDYPFESFRKLIEELGNFFPNNNEFDSLIDNIAMISEKRNSELTAGEIYLKRGGQKLSQEYFKDSIIYFGRAVLKLAKEETRNGMYLALIGLAMSYNELGLIWASNNCYISAGSISFKTWYESGIINRHAYRCVKELSKNELLLGRVSNFLMWYELLNILNRQLDSTENENDIPILELLDACFANRILNTSNSLDGLFIKTPDLLNKLNLWISEDATLYKLGYYELLMKDYKNYKGLNISNESDLDNHFELIASQPFKEQMLYDTNFMTGEKIILKSKISGMEINLIINQDRDLLLAGETLLALFESFFATSLNNIFPKNESITLNLIKNPEISALTLNKKESSQYDIEIKNYDSIENARENIIEIIGQLLAYNFYIENPIEYLENLFKNEEVNEKLSIIFQHKKFLNNILGDSSKYFFNEWVDKADYEEYPIIRENPLVYNNNNQFKEPTSSEGVFKPDNIGHNKRRIFPIIDDELWNEAKWNGFGFFGDSNGFGVFIAFENGDFGKRIFDKWIKRISHYDQEELIKITIIKGINKNNPYWYRVQIGSNIDLKSLKSNELFLSTSRIHEMTPNSSQNLDNLISLYNNFKKYRLCPAMVLENGKNIEPYTEYSIIKNGLFVKDAWEIGENDLERVAIRKDDKPVIPDDVEEAPILKLLDAKF